MDTKQKILFTSLSENELSRLMEASVRKALETAGAGCTTYDPAGIGIDML